MNIYEMIAGPDELILSALSHPTMKPGRNPTLEQAMKQVGSEIKSRVCKTVEGELEEKLEEQLQQQHAFINNEYGIIEDERVRNEWESAMDDRVEETIAPYEDHLSADWLGKNTVESGVWLENGVSKLAASAGREVYKKLCEGRTPNQILAAAGVLQDNVEIYFEQHMNGTIEEQPMTSEQPTIDTAVAKAAKHLGKGFDIMSVFNDVQQIMDADDKILTDGAAARMGLEPEDAVAMQMLLFEFDNSAQAAEECVGRITAAIQKPAEKPKRAKNTKATEGTEPPANSLAPSVFEAMKEHAGVKDTEMAKALEVSRSTYGKYIKGTLHLVPNAEQLALIKETLGASHDATGKALELCNGIVADA